MATQLWGSNISKQDRQTDNTYNKDRRPESSVRPAIRTETERENPEPSSVYSFILSVKTILS